ncbi:hypothetical protein ACL02U_21080 [Streptomyces sp. MS06]|uniref:hypothetical protein n=1 Tax=Streptomyces sp. MS06 TaxID=3385974 RepID=UPI0039A3E4A0
MALAMCPFCCGDEDIEEVRTLDDGRRLMRHRCGEEWQTAAPPAPAPERPRTRTRAHVVRTTRLPTADDVTPEWRKHADRLKERYLARHPGLAPGVAEYWAEYQQVFSPEGLRTCDPALLKDFANSVIGAHPGNQAVFNSEWNRMGEAAAAEATRRTVGYLLDDSTGLPLEDRLHHLLEGEKPFAMKGYKEALLTRTLCIVYPDRFLAILKYTTPAYGKREIARAVYGLELPAPESVDRTRGRLAVWSNDLLRTLVGDGFVDMRHAAAFLWWAKDLAGADR